MVEDVADKNPQTPTLSDLFFSFLKVSLSGFGGTLPWARRMVVEQKRWMTAAEFNEAFSLCQFLPGPNVINFAMIFGSRVRGITGGIVAVVGLVGPPIVTMLILGALYQRYGELEELQRILGGVSASAAGLIVAIAVQMAQPVFGTASWRGPLVVAVVFLAVGVFRVPLLWALVVLAPISIALAWRWPR